MENFKNLFLLFLFSISFHITAFSQTKKDSLFKTIRTAKVDTLLYQANLDLAKNYWETNADSAVYFAKKSEQIAKKIKDQVRVADAIKTIGVAYDYKGDLALCLQYLNQSLAIYQKEGKIDKQSHVFSDIGIAYYFRGNYELALRNYVKALALREKFGDQKYVAISYNNLGLVYRSKRDFTKAILYYKKALKIKEQNHDEPAMLNTYMNIGSAFDNKGVHDSAYYFAKKALFLAKKNNIESDVIASEGNIAKALANLKRYDEALNIMTKVVKKALAIKENLLLISPYETLGNIYFEKKNYNLAQTNYLKGLQVSIAINRTEPMQLFYEKLAKTNSLLGNHKVAFDYFEKATELKNKLFDTENNRQANELSAVFETSEKEKEITKLHSEKQIAQAETQKQHQQKLFLIIISILFLGLALFIYKAYSSNKKQKNLLEKQTKLLEIAVDEKNILLKETHHRVKNSFQMVSSLLYLQSENIADKQAASAIKEAHNRVKSMILIHQKLYSKEQLVGIETKDYISDLVSDIIDNQTDMIPNLETKVQVDSAVFSIDSITPLGLIINELITNCIKHAFDSSIKNPMISVEFLRQNGIFMLTVKDNGLGFKNEINEKSFGIKLIKALSKKLKATIDFKNNQGTEVVMEIHKFEEM